MKPEDIRRIRIPSGPALSPDGATVVYVETRIEDDAYVSTLNVVPADGSGVPSALTAGPRDLAPAWSPDGKRLAFLRAEPGSPPQLWLVDADGSGARRMTNHEFGVGSPVTTRHARGLATPAWAPDGHRIAYLARVTDASATGGLHRRITRLRYRIDELEFVNDRRAQIFVVDVESGEVERVGDLQWDYWDLSWHPDGRHIVAATAQHHDFDLDEANDLAILGLDGTARILTKCRTTVSLPAVSRDGQSVYFTGIALPAEDLNDARARNVGLWRVPVAGGEPERLTPAETIDLDDGRTRPLQVDEDSVFAGNLDRGAVSLLRISADGSRIQPIVRGNRQVTDYCQMAGTIVATVADATSPGEIVVIRDGREVRLTDYGSDLAPCGLVVPKEVRASAPDGYPVHGWLFLPPGPGPHPLLLYIHGGPDVQFGHAFFDEAQVYAGAGFAVAICNPRGSAAYGEAHARAIRERLGTVDADDLVAFHVALCERDDIDATRTGVLGGSYGGFMTAWLAAHHGERFGAALCERGVYSWTSMMGTSDLAVAATSMVGSDPDGWVRQSPLTYVDQIDIPVMIMHWEGDRRVPFEQSQQLFAAMRARRKQVEYVVFPGGNHNTSRNGAPAQRIERFGVVIDWFRAHLGT